VFFEDMKSFFPTREFRFWDKSKNRKVGRYQKRNIVKVAKLQNVEGVL
jgi:hypothetical protein